MYNVPSCVKHIRLLSYKYLDVFGTAMKQKQLFIISIYCVWKTHCCNREIFGWNILIIAVLLVNLWNRILIKQLLVWLLRCFV